MSLVLRSIFFLLFSAAWAAAGLFYWLLILGRVTFFVGVELFSALFTQQKPANLSPMIDQTSMVYIDGFKKIYRSFFGSDAGEDVGKAITINSLYELLATFFIAYLFFALLFPETLLPDITGILSEIDRGTTQRTSEDSEATGWFSIWSAIIGAITLIAFVIAMAFVGSLFDSDSLDDSKLLKALLKQTKLDDGGMRKLADSLNVSLPDLRKYIAATKKD